MRSKSSYSPLITPHSPLSSVAVLLIYLLLLSGIFSAWIEGTVRSGVPETWTDSLLAQLRPLLRRQSTPAAVVFQETRPLLRIHLKKPTVIIAQLLLPFRWQSFPALIILLQPHALLRGESLVIREVFLDEFSFLRIHFSQFLLPVQNFFLSLGREFLEFSIALPERLSLLWRQAVPLLFRSSR